MPSSPQRKGTGPGAASEPAGRPFPMVLMLSLGAGDPVNGTVGLVGQPPMPFHGWIDLMSAINSLRADAEQTA